MNSDDMQAGIGFQVFAESGYKHVDAAAYDNPFVLPDRFKDKVAGQQLIRMAKKQVQ